MVFPEALNQRAIEEMEKWKRTSWVRKVKILDRILGNSCKNMLAKNIKKLRKQHKLPQEELAKKAGITYSTLIKIESGANEKSDIRNSKKVSDAFNVTVDELAGG